MVAKSEKEITPCSLLAFSGFHCRLGGHFLGVLADDRGAGAHSVTPCTCRIITTARNVWAGRA